MRALARAWFGVLLWKRIAAALVLGAIFGLIAGEWAANIKWIGDLFVRLIRMLIVPLVFATLVAGVTAMDEPRRLGSIGLKALILYMATTLIAISIGLLFGAVLQPGSGIDLSGAVPQKVETGINFTDRLLAIVPANPFEAFAQGDVLAVIFFAVLTGAGILMAGERGHPLAALFQSASDVMLKLTHVVMECAPFGIFALVAWVMGTAGLATFINILLLALAVYAGCFTHMLLVQGGMVRLVGRLPVRPFFRGILDAQLVAYSTSSSSGTLPVSLSCARDNLGIRPPVASSVLPLGATVNMDGTALYVAIVALFAAQIFGIELSFPDYAMIAAATLFVSIGTAAIPSASLFLLAVVLEVIGVSAERTALIVGFILPFDRPLDMMRTVVNVTGDLAVATVVGRMEGEIDLATYNAAPVE